MKTSTGSDRIFVDTWGWLALANDKDPNHRSVRELRREFPNRGWITTDYVLDETMTRLFATAPCAQATKFVQGILESAQGGMLNLEFITPERFQAAWKLRLRYKDKPRISFTDLTSFVVMHETRVNRVITGDAHFTQVGLGFEAIP
jgi:predicted nucleic acid-binding protein